MATLAQALDSMLDPMVLLRPVFDEARHIVDFTYVDANDAASQYLNIPRTNLVGSGLVVPDQVRSSGLFAMHVRVFETGEPLVLRDFAFANPTTGAHEWLSIRETKVGEVLCFTWRNVTERVLLLDHYRLLAEHASDVVFRVTPDFLMEWVSPSVFDLQGLSPDEITGRPLADYCHADDLEPLMNLVMDTPDGDKGEMEIRILKSDGSYRWCSLIGRKIVDSDGTTLGYVGSLRDIDLEHTQREAQRESDRRYRLLAENSSDVVMVSHAGGSIKWVSSSITALVGWEPSALVGRRFAEFVHADDQTRMEEVRERLEHGDVGRLSVRLRTLDGGYHWIAVRVRDVVNQETGERERVASWRDAEQEVASRQALRESASQFRLLAENASDVVVQLDGERNFLWVSPSIEQVLGWRPGSLVGRSVTDYVIAEDPALFASTLAVSEGVRTGRVRFRLPGGTYLWMSARSKTAFDETGQPRGQVVALRDVSAEVEARETLIASEARFRLLAENANDIVLETDADTRIRWVSPSLTRILGWEPEQWVGHDPLDFIHGDDIEKVRAHRVVALRGERTAALEVRFRNDDGAYHWMSGVDHLVTNREGEITTRVLGLRSIDSEVAALESMAHAEHQYQMLAENASDIVLQIDNDSRITWVSPSVKQVLGWDPRQLIGTTTWSFLHEEDRERVVGLRRRFFMGESVDAFEVRAESKSRDLRWISMRPRAVRDEDGSITATVMSIRDVQSEVLARRALTTLSAGSRALVRATDESRLLKDMCEIAVGEGGYAFAWYARKVNDLDKTILKMASSEKNSDYLDGLTLTWAESTFGQGPTGRSIRQEETIVVPDFGKDARFAPWLANAQGHGFRTSVALPVRVGGQVDGSFMVYAADADAFGEAEVAVLESLAGELGYGLNRLREQEKLLQALGDQKLLTSAIEQATESVLILDPTFTILYANPSTERTSGYPLEEIIGRRPDMFGNGRISSEHLSAMSLALSSGEGWSGTFHNRRKDGTPYEEDATISPIHDESGKLIAYVEVKNDTSVRRLQSDLMRTRSDQNSFTEVMKSMRAAETFHASAYLFCEAAMQLPDVDVVGVLLVQPGGLLPISVNGTSVFDVDRERLIPVNDDDFFDRLAQGPLTASTNMSDWTRNPDIAIALHDEGVVALVLTPIRWDGEIFAVLALATKNPDAAKLLQARFGFYEEIATYAGSLLGPQASTYERRSVVQATIRDVIEHERFTPYFQPIVDLRTGAVHGYEALTRFEDGVRPDEMILEAFSIGLGPDLEVALATAALRVAEALPPTVHLSLNFSPDTLTGGFVDKVVAGATRPIVIEVTEHAEIGDYAELVDAVDRLPGCVLAVDDAGAGYMGFAMLLDLNPAYVKLDIKVVRDVDTNPARQAMVAGMIHFAFQTGKVVVAEGIETEAEAHELRRLGSSLPAGTLLGQGFHLGRPAPITEVLARLT